MPPFKRTFLFLFSILDEYNLNPSIGMLEWDDEFAGRTSSPLRLVLNPNLLVGNIFANSRMLAINTCSSLHLVPVVGRKVCIQLCSN